MQAWDEAPIVTIARGGESITLGRDPGDAVIHLNGSTGLGIAPVEWKSTPRTAGSGNVVHGVRYGDREVFLPIYASAPTVGELHEWRERLAGLVAPIEDDLDASVVDITFDDPTTGRVRTARGRYVSGLDGEFAGEYHGTWQTLGLVFECEPWWLGPERLVELRLAPEVKPFLSDTVSFFPVILSGSTVAGEFDVVISGDGPVWPAWEVVGPGEDLIISNGREWLEVTGEFPAGEPVLFDSEAGRIVPDRWPDLSARSRLFPLRQGSQTITASIVNATADTVVRLTYRERYRVGV